MFCPNCGVKILDKDKFCFNCGNNIVAIKNIVKEIEGEKDNLIEKYAKEKKIEDNGVEEKIPLLNLEKKSLKKEKVEEIKVEKEKNEKSIFNFDKTLNSDKKNTSNRKTFDEIKYDAKNIISTSLNIKK